MTNEMSPMEYLMFRKALRLGRRTIKVYLSGSKKPERIWSNYSLSRGLTHPIQRMPRVGHFSVPRKERGL